MVGYWKILIVAIFYILSLSSCGGSSGEDGTNVSPIGVSEHDNHVFFEFNATSHAPPNPYTSTTNFRFDGGYSITDGQPWSGVSASTWAAAAGTDGISQADVNAKAGRHKTNGPANWFNDRAKNQIAAGSFGDTKPSSLNFAFSGWLDVVDNNGVKNSYLIVTGQGSNSDGNNWWFGVQADGWSRGVTIFGGLNPCMLTPDKKYAVFAEGDGANRFRIDHTTMCVFTN